MDILIESVSASNELKLPNVIIFDDYHEMDNLKDYMSQLGMKFKNKELGFGMSSKHEGYVFLVYNGRKPKKDEIEALLKRKNIKLDDLND